MLDELSRRVRTVLRPRRRALALLRIRAVWRGYRRERDLLAREHYELTICAIFREEAPNLDEWVRFHEGVGVSKFYLYNNFSTDNFREVLAPYVARGLVDLVDWPVSLGKVAAYADCVRRRADEARWIALIDVDEFLFSPVQTDIRPILRGYADMPGLLVHSPFFGANGHAERPAGPLVRAFTRRAPLSLWRVKTIVNPRFVRSVDVHRSEYIRGEALGTDRRRLGDTKAPVLDRLRLNHYWSRSFADLEIKIARGDASTPKRRDRAWHYNFEAGLNDEEDQSILPVADAILARPTHQDRRAD